MVRVNPFFGKKFITKIMENKKAINALSDSISLSIFPLFTINIMSDMGTNIKEIIKNAISPKYQGNSSFLPFKQITTSYYVILHTK